MENFDEQLQAVRQQVSQAPQDFLANNELFFRKLHESDVKNYALKVGDNIPQFELPNALGKPVSISAMFEKSPLVIKFYRGQWCPFCSLELQHLQKNLTQIQNCPAKLVAISPQTPDNSLSTVQKHQLTFEVLSDVGNKVGKQFGLVYQIPKHLNELYKKYGIDFQFFNGEGEIELPMPAYYVVDTKGMIVFADVPIFADQRQDPKILIQFLRANFGG